MKILVWPFLLLVAVLRIISIPNQAAVPKPVFESAHIRLNKPTNFIDRQIKAVFPEPHASLLSGIMVGTKTQMPKDFYYKLQKTGTLHIIALSGTNIAMIISFLAVVFGGFGKKASVILSLICIIGFIFFVGFSASVVRAGIMGCVGLLSVLFGRKYNAAVALVGSGIIMVIFSPALIFDVGFQLSFAATLGIILLGRQDAFKSAKSIAGRVAQTLLIELKITLSAQLFTIPIIIYNFHNLSIVAPITNILVGWSIQFIMAGGFIVTFLNFISFKLINLSFLLYPLLSWFVFCVEYTGSLSFSSLTISTFPWWMAFAYYAVVLIGIALLKI
jgi:competence protein ComEC